MTIYELLDSRQKPRDSFYKTEEYDFYTKNKSRLSKLPRFSYLMDSREDFDVFRTNIVLHGLDNKNVMEKEILSMNKYFSQNHKDDLIHLISTIKEKMIDAPYYTEDDKNKIYIPFFSRSLNQLYLRDPAKLLVSPYSNLNNDFADSIIDPFDTYGALLYNSLFTSLLLIENRNGECAYFHYDTNTIYFVNDQGRLDNKLVLFDRYIKNPSFNHMLERIKPVVEAYYDGDRSRMINGLFQNGFISNKCLSLINRYMKRR